jgi:hypothetical protein
MSTFVDRNGNIVGEMCGNTFVDRNGNIAEDWRD